MNRIKRIIYRLGFRPKYPSIWYSPGLSWNYAYIDAVKRSNINE